MPACFDLICAECSETFPNVLFPRGLPHSLRHVECGGEVGLTLLSSGASAQWSERDAIAIWEHPQTGEVAYPPSNDVEMPERYRSRGFVRRTMRSWAEVRRFEREKNVVSEAEHFDKGSGRGHDDTFRGRPYS